MSTNLCTSDTDSVLAAVRAAAAPWGLNLIGTVDARAYDAAAPAGHRLTDVLPDAQSALLIGNAGRAFWERFRDWISREPARARRAHPLDTYTVEVVETLRPLLRARDFTERTVYPFYGASDHALSFQRLAMAAGFGVDSVLGLVLHPEFGPWMATRAAILTAAHFRASGALEGFDPCTHCPAPCISVCPGGAFPGRRWSSSLCLQAKRTLDSCRETCLSRIHCVFGAGHRYSDDETAYHSTHPSGARLDLATTTRLAGD